MKRSTTILLTVGILVSAAFTFHLTAQAIVVPAGCWDIYDVKGTSRHGTLAPLGLNPAECTPGEGCWYGYRASDGKRDRWYVPYRTNPRFACGVPPQSTGGTTTATTVAPTTAAPTTAAPTTAAPTTVAPTTAAPTTVAPTTAAPTTAAPTTAAPTTAAPTTTPPTTAAPIPVSVGAFVEDFTGGTGLENLDTGVYHRDTDTQGSGNNSGSWTGDHDLACGGPDTQRTITKAVRSDTFYMCRDHMMTSVGHVDSYSVAWFTPKQTFSNVRTVSWDVNVTDLMARQWWEVSVVPATFNSGISTCRYCTAIDWLAAAGLPAYPQGSVTVGNGPFGGGFSVHANNQDFNPLGWQGVCGQWGFDPEGCASKSIRRTFTLADNGDGTMTLNAFGRIGTFAGSFPAGDVKVVFKDHNYTPDKDGTPVGHTWHWDNIIVK